MLSVATKHTLLLQPLWMSWCLVSWGCVYRSSHLRKWSRQTELKEDMICE